MRNYFKKYLAGCLLLLLIMTIAGSFNSFLLRYEAGLKTAAVFYPTSLPTDADPASGFAWNDNVGWINFGDESSSEEGRVYVSNDRLYGYAWGENIGWISLNCANTEANDCSTYGVSQDPDKSGILTGYAWGENIGWINFAPTGGGVTITNNTSGTNTFSGYAWGENIGWISFSGTSPDYGVTTTWTKPGGGGSNTVTIYSDCVFEYSEWGECINGEKTRTVTPDPASCINNTPEELIQSCTATTTETIATSTATSTPIEVTISPKTATLFAGQTQQFTANVTGTTTNNDVTWMIWPIETLVPDFYGHINNTGKYFAPMTASGTINVTVFATAKADSNKKATAEVIIRLATTTQATTTPIIATSTASSTPISTTTDKASLLPVDDTNDNKVIKDNNPISNDTGGHSSGNNKTKVENIIKTVNISSFVTDNVAVLGTTTERIILGAQKILESPAGSAVANTITTVGVVGGGVAATGVLALNSTAVADMLFIPFKLWGLLLSVLGLKKRNRPWGTVYDSITKQPIDPAYVTITNLETKKEEMSITDLDGRYGFLVAPGKYVLSANKTNYIFPSKKLAGKTEDTLYNNLYFGEEINAPVSGAVISKNIPLDPIKFDWNEFVKGQKKLMKFYSRREKVTKIITDWIFRIGFIISLISLFLVSAPYNYIIFALYIILVILRKFGLKQKKAGSLTDKEGNPLSFAIVRVFDAELKVPITNKVADQIGKYYCLVNKGKYYVRIEKKNDDESYTEIFTSPVFEATDGIINKSFVI